MSSYFPRSPPPGTPPPGLLLRTNSMEAQRMTRFHYTEINPKGSCMIQDVLLSKEISKIDDDI